MSFQETEKIKTCRVHAMGQSQLIQWPRFFSINNRLITCECVILSPSLKLNSIPVSILAIYGCKLSKTTSLAWPLNMFWQESKMAVRYENMSFYYDLKNIEAMHFKKFKFTAEFMWMAATRKQSD